MGRIRTAALVVAAALVAGTVGTLVPAPAGADGPTEVPVTCRGIPIVGDVSSTADIDATDSVDPVAPGGAVTNLLKVPVPVGEVPIDATVKEVKITVPVPTGVTVTGVTFSTSTFTPSWVVTGSDLVVTVTGNVPIGPGKPLPTVPDVSVATTVAGPARTVSWKVPSSIVAKATYFLGGITATCTPDDPTQVLITTTVAVANQAPTATDQSVSTAYGSPTAITLGGTDPEGSPLTFAVTGGPAHGTLSGTPPALTYTPAAGYSGPDSFTFTASDGSLSDTGTVAISVVPTAPGAPAGVWAQPQAGRAVVTWTAPSSTGGRPLTGYRVTPEAAGVAQAPIVVGPDATTVAVDGLTDGVAHTFRVAATNDVGTGPDSAPSASVTPQGWLPFASWADAVVDIHQWLLGRPPTALERTQWVATLGAGPATLGSLVEDLRAGPDSVEVIDPVARLYSAYFLRPPDHGGLTYWIGRRRGGAGIRYVSEFFAASREFTNRYGALSDRQFVELVYRNVLGREGDQGGIDFWTGELAAGRRTRGWVMIGFSNSSEYRAKQAANVEAGVLWVLLGAVTPTTAQRDSVVVALDGGASVADVVRTLLREPAVVAHAQG